MEFITKDHTDAFGVIMYKYAAAETGIKITLAGILDIHLHELMILCEPYSSVNLRNVAKSIVKSRFKSTVERDRFLGLVGQLGSFGPLRNNIGHSRWTAGTRRGSIKPFGLDIRSGSVKYIGKLEEERDWTAQELKEEGWKLTMLNSDIVQFMEDAGLDKIIQAKIDSRSAETDSEDGSSTND